MDYIEILEFILSVATIPFIIYILVYMNKCLVIVNQFKKDIEGDIKDVVNVVTSVEDGNECGESLL